MNDKTESGKQTALERLIKDYQSCVDFQPHSFGSWTIAPGLIAAARSEHAALIGECESTNACLAMIRETLDPLECLHGKHSGESTPPMMYPEWILCVMAKEKQRTAALVAKLKRMEKALELWVSYKTAKMLKMPELENLEKTANEATREALTPTETKEE